MEYTATMLVFLAKTHFHMYYGNRDKSIHLPLETLINCL